MTHTSPTATIEIECSDNTKYEVLEVAGTDATQYIEHGVAANGFMLPTYKNWYKTLVPETGAYPG